MRDSDLVRQRVAVLAPAALAWAGAATAVVLAAQDRGAVANQLAVLTVVAAYVSGAVVIMLTRPGDRIGELMLAGGTAWGLGECALALAVHGQVVVPGSVPGADWLGVLGSALRGFGWLVLVVAVPLCFPDGRSAWVTWSWPPPALWVAIGLFCTGAVLAPSPLDARLDATDSPTGLADPWTWVADVLALAGLGLSAVLLVVAVAGLVHRWRTADDLERHHLHLYAWACACPLVLLPVVALPWAAPWMFALVSVPVPIVVAVAVFQLRAREGRERLVRAREEERRRLRRDLHDGLGPTLAALTLRVDTLRNRREEAGLDLDAELLGLRAGIQGAVGDVRRVVEGLRPPALDELGVTGALEQLAVGLALDEGLSVDVRAQDLPAFPAAVEVALYRVAQEALTNVVKHACASRAQVDVSVSGDEVRLAITDNGAGGAASRAGGLGMSTMRERAEEVGGWLRVSTRPDQGTTVVMALPLGVNR